MKSSPIANVQEGELNEATRKVIVEDLKDEIARLKKDYGLKTTTTMNEITTDTTIDDNVKKLRASVVHRAQERIRLIGALAVQINDVTKPVLAKDLHGKLIQLEKQMKSTGSSGRFSFKAAFFVKGKDNIRAITKLVASKIPSRQRKSVDGKLSVGNETVIDSKAAVVNKAPVVVPIDKQKLQKDITSFLSSTDNTINVDDLAGHLYSNTVGGGGESKQLADSIIRSIENSMNSINMDQLAALTAAVMQKQCGGQVVAVNEPFLRRTGVITDRLYALCREHSNCDLNSPSMDLVHERILIGTGYKSGEPGNAPNNMRVKKNAATEISFKVGALANEVSKKLTDLGDKLSAPPDQAVRMRFGGGG